MRWLVLTLLLITSAHFASAGAVDSKEKARWEAHKKYRLEHESVDPVVTLTANDNWLEFTMRYIVDYKKRRTTKDQLFEGIINKIESTDGKVAMASTTLQLIDLPLVKLDIPNKSVQS